MRSGVAVAVLGLGLGACAIQPEPLTRDETQARIETDLQAMFSEQEPIDGPLTLYEAMARAVMYNLDHRVEVMNEAISQHQLDLSRYDLLPRVVAESGYRRRSNVNASSSENVETGVQSLAPSTSEERDSFTADLNLTWNVLDFGVSYFTAQQQADRAMIAYERRRKVVHGIIQDVRAAYWRAVAAQRLQARVGPLLARVEAARANSERIEELRLDSPLNALNYQRTVLDAKRQLQTLRQDLALAKIELATLMNLPPDRDFELEMPADDVVLGRLALQPAELEQLALAYRPELREQDYQSRVSATETRKALVRFLPGLEVFSGLHYDSNDFLVNQNWADYGVRVSWNLLNLLSAPARFEQAESQEQLVAARRQALSMAVLTQLYVAYGGYRQAEELYRTNQEVADVEKRILEQLRTNQAAANGGELAVIRGELNALVAQLRRDLAFARAQNALGQVYLTVGADPLPEQIEAAEVDVVADAIRDTLRGWQDGKLFMRSTLLEIGAEQGKPQVDGLFEGDAG
ncbi:transporter [Rhodovibrio sodomensis]|uniref:Transporter n=1 Tax=Rhodovibrio sodomensis TaxID=1088 RepID=A0ABS1DKW4_9PROT|nr:transporter [Rhodovibrio sodomensis]